MRSLVELVVDNYQMPPWIITILNLTPELCYETNGLKKMIPLPLLPPKPNNHILTQLQQNKTEVQERNAQQSLPPQVSATLVNHQSREFLSSQPIQKTNSHHNFHFVSPNDSKNTPFFCAYKLINVNIFLVLKNIHVCEMKPPMDGQWSRGNIGTMKYSDSQISVHASLVSIYFIYFWRWIWKNRDHVAILLNCFE